MPNRKKPGNEWSFSAACLWCNEMASARSRADIVYGKTRHFGMNKVVMAGCGFADGENPDKALPFAVQLAAVVASHSSKSLLSARAGSS